MRRTFRVLSCVVQGGTRPAPVGSPAFLQATPPQQNRVRASRFVLAFWFERLRHYFPVRFLQQNLHLAFRFFQLFLALPRQRHTFLKKFHRFVQRKLRAFQFTYHFFQSRQRPLKIRLLRRFRFFRYRCIHAAFSFGAVSLRRTQSEKHSNLYFSAGTKDFPVGALHAASDLARRSKFKARLVLNPLARYIAHVTASTSTYASAPPPPPHR